MGSLREALSLVAGRPHRGTTPSTPAPAVLRRGRRAAALAMVAATGLLAACGGSDEAATPAQPESDVELPLQQIADLREAAEAAGCELINASEEGSGHADRQFTAEDYKTNPPTSGDHHPEWYDDGIYEPGATDNLGMLVHTLEHGRINVQYKPGTPDEVVDQLEALLAESEGYHMLLYENNTDMKYAVAASAWTRAVGCPEMNDKVFDALRTFRTRYIDKAPEQVP